MQQVTTQRTIPNPANVSPAGGPRLVQTLGLFSSTALVIGSMIGSGIFLVDADIARVTNSPALYLGAWVVTGVLTIIAALSYGELAAMMPKAGGQYVYLRESLGPLWGFLYGWTLFLVIQTGTIAAVAVAFAKFAGEQGPRLRPSNNWPPRSRWPVPKRRSNSTDSNKPKEESPGYVSKQLDR